MDPLCEYYLCTKDGETTMVAAYPWDRGAIDECDSVQELPYWQAMQLNVGLMELERSSMRAPELFPLAAFMGAEEDRILELLCDGSSR